MTIQAKIPPQRQVGTVSMNADLAVGPWFIDGCDTVVKLFADRCRTQGEATAHREKHLGIWLSHSWNDFYRHARLIGLGLIALGLRRGEVVSILSEDRKEWLYADFGAQGAGAVVSGVYTTDPAAQLRYLIDDSASRFLFVENDEQLDKYLEIRDRVPGLEKVIVFEREGLQGFSDPRVIFLDELYALGQKFAEAEPDRFEREIARSDPNDIAILVYTSGTTGPPKGAMLSHGNLMFSISGAALCLPSLSSDEQICFLPLCHILERLVSGFLPIVSRVTLNFAESPETVFENLQEVRPHSFVAVPRVWEKIYSRVTIMVGDATGFQKWAFANAVRAGSRKAAFELEGRPVPVLTALIHRFWDFAVLRNMRRTLGMDRLRRGNTGAAPISPDLLRWYRAIGVQIMEGYGMTESSGLISVNTFEANRIGTVGRVVPGAALRIAPDGEIQYRGGNVFSGYLKKPEKTAETMTPDGWLRTGDIGRIDEDGFLAITGRLKDLIITAGGKNVAPAEIENRLKFSPYISDAVVIGDRRKYLTALIMIDQENVEKFAQENRVPFGDFRSLCAAAEVRDLIAGVVEETNRELARVEQIKDFRLIDTLLTAEDEELTPTMKLKRSLVEKKHGTLIDQMYPAGESSHRGTRER
jgi:long-chain acyl-CoA synthetase